MTARDVITEIAAARERRLTESASGDLSLRLFALESTFKEFGRANNETIRYFPVALVATMEGMVRAAIRDLIDAGDPYVLRAEKLASKLKLDYALIMALQGKQVTVGEFVAHGVPISRIEHIDAALSELLGTSFLAGLRTVTDRWAAEIGGQARIPILTDPARVFDEVKRTFELRHIICHELALGFTFQAEEIERCFESCVRFLRAADEFIFQTMYPNAPLTQADLNQAAGAKLGEVRARLDHALAEAKRRLNAERGKEFDAVQAQWGAFHDAWVHLVVGDRAHGGSIWPLHYANASGVTVQRRLAEIEEFIDRFEDLYRPPRLGRSRGEKR